MVMANYCIMAPFTATQDTKRELAHVVGVDRYLQDWCSGLAAYLTTTIPQAFQPISDLPCSKKKQKDVFAHFENEKSTHQINLISAYNPFPAPQLSGDFISMSFCKSTRRCPLILISNNLTTKDLCVTNKYV